MWGLWHIFDLHTIKMLVLHSVTECQSLGFTLNMHDTYLQRYGI